MPLPRAEKLLVAGIVAAVLLPLALVIGKRWAGPDAERRAAMALMREPLPPVKGRDGSDAIWLLTHDVPANERAAVAAQLRTYVDQAAVLTQQGKDAEREALPDPRARFRKFPAIDADMPGVCGPKRRDCLAHVQADPDATGKILDANASGLRATLDIQNYDGMRVGTRPHISGELPLYSSQRPLVPAHYALMFVKGSHQEAVAGVCQDGAAWRRLGSDSDVLIGGLVGAAYVRQDLTLLAEMLATLPARDGLPAPCSTMLADIEDDELTICPHMKYQFGMSESMSFDDPRGIFPRWTRLRDATVDRHSMMGVYASQLAPYCDKAGVANARADRPWTALHLQPAKCNWLESLSDPVGCSLVDAFPLDFGRYVDRRTDLAAAIALMRTVVWLRETSNDPTTWPTLLPKRPASLGLKREPKISADGARVSIVLLDQSRDEEFSLPLRPSTQTGAPSRASPPDGD